MAVFAGLVTAQMLLWARKRHSKYLRQVKNDRSYWRTAVIPLLI